MEYKTDKYKEGDVIVKDEAFWKCRIAGVDEALFNKIDPWVNGFSSNQNETLVLRTNKYDESVRETSFGKPYYRFKYPVVASYGECCNTAWKLSTLRSASKKLYIDFLTRALEEVKALNSIDEFKEVVKDVKTKNKK